MAIKFIAKKYYTFSELAQHWQCELSEIRHAVINGDLVPSIHVSGRKYETFQFSPDDEGDGFKYPSPLFDWDNRTESNEVKDWVSGFRYLILPTRISAFDCVFRYFSQDAVDFEDGDLCHSLYEQLGIEEVMEVGIVMATEVARLEAILTAKDQRVSSDMQPLGRWPWGDHHTELLGHLEAAAWMFWVNYDPTDATTAPKNIRVSEWLQTERKVSQTMADSIASMLRPDGLPTGPRK